MWSAWLDRRGLVGVAWFDLVGWSVGWLVGRSVGWLVGWMVGGWVGHEGRVRAHFEANRL